MVRPERIIAGDCGDSRCIELAGESPVAVSAGAPRSRLRATRETSASEWSVKSPQRVVWLVGGEQVRRPSIMRTLQPREIRIRKETGWPSRSCHGEGNRLHFATGTVQDARGVWRRACGQMFDAEQERPVPAAIGEGQAPAASGEGGPYKPTAKAERVGWESEGSIVPKGRLCLPMTSATNAGRGKGPCFGYGRVRR